MERCAEGEGGVARSVSESVALPVPPPPPPLCRMPLHAHRERINEDESKRNRIRFMVGPIRELSMCSARKCWDRVPCLLLSMNRTKRPAQGSGAFASRLRIFHITHRSLDFLRMRTAKGAFEEIPRRAIPFVQVRSSASMYSVSFS